MSEDTAKMLDGPVAWRFDRPTVDGGDLALKGDDWVIVKPGLVDVFPCEQHVAAALWLAHLLAACGENRWCVHLWDAIPGKALAEACVSDWTNSHFDYESKGATILEALATAMIDVPEGA